MALKSAGLICELRVLHDGEKAINFIDEFDADPNAAAIDLLLIDTHLPKRDILKRLCSSDHYAQVPAVRDLLSPANSSDGVTKEPRGKK